MSSLESLAADIDLVRDLESLSELSIRWPASSIEDDCDQLLHYLRPEVQMTNFVNFKSSQQRAQLQTLLLYI